MVGENQAPVASTNSGRTGGGGRIILIIIIVLIVVGLGGVVVYARYFNKTNSTLSSIVPKALNANCKQNDPDLCKFLNNWQNITDYTMAMTSDLSGKTSESTFKVDDKNKIEMVNKTGGKEDYHTIQIDKTTYMLDYTDNKWWKYEPKATDDSVIKETKDFVDFNVEEDKTTYKKIGKEACGKFNCFKYQVIDPANTESTEYIYFDDKEYVLRKTRSESKDGSIIEATFEYGNTLVSAPSPVKEGNPFGLGTSTTGSSSGLSTGNSSSSGVSQEDLQKALNEIQAQSSSE